MAGAYYEIELDKGYKNKLSFTLRDSLGEAIDLSSYTTAKMIIANMDDDTKNEIGTVSIEPDSQIGVVDVSIDINELDFIIFDTSEEDKYGEVGMHYAYSISLDDECKLKGKAQIFEVA